MIFHECNEKILTQFHALQKSETCSVATLRRWAGRPSMKKSESYFHCGQGHFSASKAEQHEDGDYMSYVLEVIIGSYLLWKILSEFDWANVICLIFHKAGLFHAHWFPVVFCSQQDLTSADAVLAFPFTSLKPALWAFCYAVNKSFSFFSFLKLSTGFLT